MTPLKLALAGSLIALAVGGATQSCNTAASAPTATTTPSPTTTSGAAGTATVTGTEASGDKNKPNGLTHYADCTGADGSEYRVIVSADVEYSLRAGQPCPAGQHVPTARQENPGLYDEISSALNAPLPYHGGDNGPCASWSAGDKATADQAQAEWKQCMATHGGNR